VQVRELYQMHAYKLMLAYDPQVGHVFAALVYPIY
jgi:hypothetical protein